VICLAYPKLVASGDTCYKPPMVANLPVYCTCILDKVMALPHHDVPTLDLARRLQATRFSFPHQQPLRYRLPGPEPKPLSIVL